MPTYCTTKPTRGAGRVRRPGHRSVEEWRDMRKACELGIHPLGQVGICMVCRFDPEFEACMVETYGPL